jgi:hypothetical protein
MSRLPFVREMHYVALQSTPSRAKKRLISWPRGTPSEVRPVPEGYCVKEKKKVEIKDPKQVTMKNGRAAIQGTCPDCGTKIFKIGKLE